jgi:uncharacterized protein YutE (UPF0331/DUF86 family)
LPVVDRDLVRRKLTELSEYVSQVSEYRDVTIEQYRADWKTQRIVERTLQMAIEACVDVASHMVADRGLRAPATYADTFEILVQAGLLSPDLGGAMVKMTGFRNVVVHDYAGIDVEVVLRVLRERLDDFRRFETEALRWG